MSKFLDKAGLQILAAKIKEAADSSASVGDLSSLATNSKTDAVSAINELYNAMFDVSYAVDMSTWRDSNVTSGNWYAPVELSDGTLVVSSGSGSGIKYSTDKGATWQDSNVTSGEWYTPAVLSDGTLVAGSRGSGIKYSTDKGATWRNSNIVDDYWQAFVELSDGTLVAGSNSTKGIKYSTDKGATWQDSNVTSGSWYNLVKLSDGTLVAGSSSGNGIKYSTDKGATWQDSNVTRGNWYNLVELSDGTLVAGSIGRGIKYSTDKGATWQDSNITSDSWSTIFEMSDGTLVACSNNNKGIEYCANVKKATPKWEGDSEDMANIKINQSVYVKLFGFEETETGSTYTRTFALIDADGNFINDESALSSAVSAICFRSGSTVEACGATEGHPVYEGINYVTRKTNYDAVITSLIDLMNYSRYS